METNVVSVFDGMACGMLAMMEAGVKVGRYVAFEIDKYAVATSSHNFPQIEHRGDVFKADFTEFEGFDWLVGGSLCVHHKVPRRHAARHPGKAQAHNGGRAGKYDCGRQGSMPAGHLLQGRHPEHGGERYRQEDLRGREDS